jgi:hypothetical protein
VYGGRDPLTKQRHVLTEVIPKGPTAQRDAERARDRLLVQVAERRNPKTSATLDQLLERYLDQFQGSANTLQLYQTHVGDGTLLRIDRVGMASGHDQAFYSASTKRTG